MVTSKTRTQKPLPALLISLFILLFIQIANGQNVGIGTISPQAKLDVTNSFRVGGANKYLFYDSTSGKFIWNDSTLFIPVPQQIIQHSA